ncbi:hypothetical protein shn_25380 (plasmid) [Shinella sp. HZN7]|nr:hypothetical protein shn_25380 [Shinella sp. HZN7]
MAAAIAPAARPAAVELCVRVVFSLLVVQPHGIRSGCITLADFSMFDLTAYKREWFSTSEITISLL